MGVLREVDRLDRPDRPECLLCSANGPDVRERGRIVPLSAELCDDCWNRLANELALCEGATATPDPDPDPEDTDWAEPRTCGRCHATVRCFPTNYDRWVELAMFELPAKKGPPQHRWRLIRPTAPNTPIQVATVATRIGAIDPTPGEPVIPAHEFVCLRVDP